MAASVLLLQHGLQIVSGYFLDPGEVHAAVTPLIRVGEVIQVVGSLPIITGVAARPAVFVFAGEMTETYRDWHASQQHFSTDNGGEAPIL